MLIGLIPILQWDSWSTEKLYNMSVIGCIILKIQKDMLKT